jgi:hypothetical protein
MALVLATSACKTTGQPGATVKDFGGGTIMFPADFSPPIQSGAINPGGTVSLLYAQARLNNFRNCYQHGAFSGGITPQWSVDGGQAMNAASGGGPWGSQRTINGQSYLEFAVAAPSQGSDWALWFIVANAYGQCGVDSNESTNYHFNLGS